MDDLDELIGRLRERLAGPHPRVDVDVGAAGASATVTPPATRQDLDAAQIALGIGVPSVLRRILSQVADGGFGPGAGLLGSRDLIRVTGRCRRLAEPWGGWPDGHLPVADLGDGSLACTTSRDPMAPVTRFDPHGLGDDAVLADAFVPVAPSLVAWLAEWVGSPGRGAPRAVVGPP